ncbi:MAG: septum site-determining protein MinD, partial [Helicobacter sp.]|nr:septum site-determining protein MinD [Helicobacter sp.]
AGIESGFEHAAFLADRALIVTTPEVSAVRDADRVIGIIDAKSEKAKAGLQVRKEIIINRVRADMIERGEMMSIDDVLQILALTLIGIVPEDEKVISATNLGEPVIYSHCISGEAYKRIAKRVVGEDVPFMDLQQKGGFFSSLKRLFS